MTTLTVRLDQASVLVLGGDDMDRLADEDESMIGEMIGALVERRNRLEGTRSTTMSRDRDEKVARIVDEAPEPSEALIADLVRILRPHVDVWRIRKAERDADERGSP